MPSDNKFWARTDSEEIVSKCEEKFDRYSRMLRGSIVWRRILRNIRYHSGNYFPGSPESMQFEMRLTNDNRIAASVNLYRTLVKQTLLLATGDRVEFKTRALNTDTKSRVKAQLGDSVLTYYMRDHKFNRYLRNGGEQALLFNSGFTQVGWDASKGTVSKEDPVYDENGKAFAIKKTYQGDAYFRNPTINDIAYDWSLPSWDDVPYAIVKGRFNKWDLAEKFPEHKDAILDAKPEARWDPLRIYTGIYALAEEDTIEAYELFYKPCDALPEGRYVLLIRGEEALLDDKNPDGIPLFRCSDGEQMLTALGYSMANDLQSLQEMVNGTISAIATNLSAFGVSNIWQRPNDKLTSKTFEGGLRALVSETKPEAINFTAIPQESWKMIDVLMRAMSTISGVNSVQLGNPDPVLRSAKSLQYVGAQAQFAVSLFASSWRMMAEDSATYLLKLISKHSQGERIVPVVGKSNAIKAQKYMPQSDLEIDRVVIEVVDPQTNTYPGRVAKASDLLQGQVVKNYREYMSVIKDGDIDALTEFESSQLNLVHEENDLLLQLKPVEVSPLDAHVLHIKEHSVPLNTIENRQNQQVLDFLMAHIQAHVAEWMTIDPNNRAMQAALSNEAGPMPAMPGGPGGGPPQGPVPPGARKMIAPPEPGDEGPPAGAPAASA